MQVVLVRHGAHDEVSRVLSGRSEIALNARGKAEADALAQALESMRWASLHSSPRARAIETIAPLAQRGGPRVRIASELDEIDFGTFTGRTFADLGDDPAWHRWNAERSTARCPGGETMAEAIERAVAYLSALTPADFPALCVTHCDIIRGIVARLLGADFGRMFLFDCDPGSRTTLDLSGARVRLVSLNERVLL